MPSAPRHVSWWRWTIHSLICIFITPLHTSSAGKDKMAPQLKNEYKLNICWIQLFTDFFLLQRKKRKKIMEKKGLDLSRKQNWLLMLVNESRLPEAQAEMCVLIFSYTRGSRIFCFPVLFYSHFYYRVALCRSFISPTTYRQTQMEERRRKRGM